MKLVLSSLLLAFAGGCFAEATVPAPMVTVAPAPVMVAPAPPPGPVVVDEEQPDLVEVSPGVQVIYDYDEPIFFTDGFYWRESGGVWYSSRSYRGGWGMYGGGVPGRFRGMDTHRYAHYRPAGYVPRHEVRDEHRGEVRDEHRDDHHEGEVRDEHHEDVRDEHHDDHGGPGDHHDDHGGPGDHHDDHGGPGDHHDDHGPAEHGGPAEHDSHMGGAPSHGGGAPAKAPPAKAPPAKSPPKDSKHH